MSETVTPIPRRVSLCVWVAAKRVKLTETRREKLEAMGIPAQQAQHDGTSLDHAASLSPIPFLCFPRCCAPLTPSTMADKKLLQGKTVLITGASRGVGETLSCHLARHGAKLVLVSEKGDDLKQVGLGAASYWRGPRRRRTCQPVPPACLGTQPVACVAGALVYWPFLTLVYCALES